MAKPFKVGDPVWVFRPSVGDALEGVVSEVLTPGQIRVQTNNRFEADRVQTRVYHRPDGLPLLVNDMEDLADTLLRTAKKLREAAQ